MPINIYAAPQAPLTAPVAEQIGRPVSVFLLQACAAVMFLLAALVAGGMLSKIVRFGGAIVGREWWLQLAGGAIGVGMLALILIIGLQRRWKAGCVGGVLCVLLPIIAIGLIWRGRPATRSIPELLGQLSAVVLLSAPFLYWAYALGFSRKSKTYFRTVRTDAVNGKSS